MEMLFAYSIQSVIVIAGPHLAAMHSADFHWPQFRFDDSPVCSPNWMEMWSHFSTWVSGGFESVVGGIVIVAMIASVFGYVKALAEVKAGRLIVYRDWGDFLKSSAWIVLIPLGVGWCFDDSVDFLFRIAGLASIGYGVYCLWSMISGAFKYNTGNGRWLALFARFAVTMLVIFALAKLNEQFENYKHGRYGYGVYAVVRGVLIPLAIFSWVFRALIQPMVGIRYYRIRRSMESW